MNSTTKPGVLCGGRRAILVACVVVFLARGGWGQEPVGLALAPAANDGASGGASGGATDSVAHWEGLPVRSISFEGLPASRVATVAGHLAQAVGAPLDREALKRSLRELFSTGLYETVDVAGAREGDGVALVFRGSPRRFIGTVSVDGAKGGTMNTQLERASQLSPGTRFTDAKLSQALDQMRQLLSANGFHEPAIKPTLTPQPAEQLVDIAFQVTSGPQARVGKVEVTGDSGMSAEEFRRHAHLRLGSHMDHDTANHALDGVLKYYQAHQRLEAEIKLEQETYDAATRRTNFLFSANRGPEVKVLVVGAPMSAERVKHVIPIFEEGTVDDDLLNEGNRRVRDYYQRLGYFDVKVGHDRVSSDSKQVVIRYAVTLGPRRHVQDVSVTGNHYFDSVTLKELLSVHAADTLDSHGAYSQALVSADVSALQGVYQDNGFWKVKITPETSTPETVAADASGPQTVSDRTTPLRVVYRIEEGEQQRVHSVSIDGNEHVSADKLTPLLNTTAGQLLSPRNLVGDRDELLTSYYGRGFEQVRVEVAQKDDSGGSGLVDVVFHITEGTQIFVRKVLVTGLQTTRPSTVARAITLHAGDPLNLNALTDTQRNLYDLALFNEVSTAVENPTGSEPEKTILLQAVEARRWAFTYGFGFEAQTGTPQYNCGFATVAGIPCNPNGKTGVSPRVLADLTRNSLFGRDLSASIQGTYGLLEQKINLLFQDPHFAGSRNFGLAFSGGYANSQDVTTYVASRLEANVRWTENFLTPGSWLSKDNTLIYEYNFRRVKVEEDSLQVGPFALTQLSTAVRVAGPSITWIRDHRDSALDAHRGSYTSFQEFISDRTFGAQAEFNRVDVSNSSYYQFDKGRIVLARNTRYGQERVFAAGENEMIPLPERLYGGGPTSLRGFAINGAGPRDPETGYPIGGAGALANSTEIRLPPPNLPWFGNTVSFVLFHDMGNIFTNASDAWASALRTKQPDRNNCKILTNYDSVDRSKPPPLGPTASTGPEGLCSFNYFSQAPGIGVRYHTPVGPIRLDFSYDLNPPIYPVIYDYSNPSLGAHVGEGNHFNFFFSLGQTF